MFRIWYRLVSNVENSLTSEEHLDLEVMKSCGKCMDEPGRFLAFQKSHSYDQSACSEWTLQPCSMFQSAVLSEGLNMLINHSAFLYIGFHLYLSFSFLDSIPKADILVSSTKATVADFARDRTLKKLSFNEEQIHKFDK